MYPNLVSAFYGSPWAILPSKLAEMRAFLALSARGEKVDPETVARVVQGRRVLLVPKTLTPEAVAELKAAWERWHSGLANAAATTALAASRPGGAQMYGRVALLPVFGVLAQRVGMMEAASGGVSTEEVGAALDALVRDRGVKCVALVFDSPGGSVFGVQELCNKIASLKAEKKIIAVADSCAASAAYWLAAQCSELVVTPGGIVGSIGVVVAHEDMSAALEQAGVKTTLVTSAPYKAEGDPSQPLSEAAKAELQSKVDHYHALFVQSVAKGRGTTEARVRADFGQGRVVTAQEAKDKGMVDRVATLEQTLHRLGAAADAPARAMALARARAVEAES